MSKRPVLTAIDFGQRIAEAEGDALESYFVETEQWGRVFSGEIDIVYGPKGSGKSAIYSLLLRKTIDLERRQIRVVAGENPMGTPVFAGLLPEAAASEERLRGLWKLYFLSLLAKTFRSLQISGNSANEIASALEDAGLVSREWSLRRIFSSVLEYVKKIQIGAEAKIDPITGMPEFGGKITFGEPTMDQQKQGCLSVDSMLEIAERALTDASLKIWIVLDRLDVAFLDSPELETKALRALFRAYLDMIGLPSISLKVFLRDDIWKRIADSGFREASHITRYTKITWDQQSLMNLVVRRALHNQAVREYYKVDQQGVLADVILQERLFYRIFPQHVDSGSGKPSTLNWILSRTCDGSRQCAPREVIHLVSSAREHQLKSIEVGGAEPTGEILIDRGALKAGLPTVSKERYQQTLCSEHPSLKTFLNLLDGQKTQQTPKSLAKIWGIAEAKAVIQAERLADVGFFEKRGSKESPEFWVPFVYRDALNMIQGPAK